MKIRNATYDDLPQLMQLKGSGENRLFQERIRLSNEGRTAYLIAEEAGQVIGHVFLKYYGKPSAPDFPDIEDLFVDAAFRREGVATKLLCQCEQLARARGYVSIGLAASVDEHDAGRRLYRKLGFIESSTPPYVDGVYNGVEDWVIDMVKHLR